MTAAVSAVVVNYNAGPFLRECVASLLNGPVDVNIIIVDNASSDKSLDGLSESPQVRILRNQDNLGFAAACNIGGRVSDARRILFLNPDCVVAPDALARMVEVLESSHSIGMVGGLLCNPDGSEQAGGRRVFPTPRRAFVRAFGLSHLATFFPRLFADFLLHKEPVPSRPLPVEAISGACMLVKREAVNDVGLWDEGYFLHCEDLDWCMRFRQKGWEVVFVPDARVVHDKGTCSRGRPFFVEWHKHRGMLRFYRKFFRHQYPGVLWALVVVGVWLRFLLVAAHHAVRLGLAKVKREPS